MPKLYLYYSLPLSKEPVKRIISNPTTVYSDEQLTEPVGVMQDYCVHDILDASLITPLVGIKYLPDNKIKVVHLNPSFDSPQKCFSVEYVANTLQPIETTIITKQNMPKLQKVVRYITKITETETFGKLELTIQ
jgi:hypothetical protein